MLPEQTHPHPARTLSQAILVLVKTTQEALEDLRRAVVDLGKAVSNEPAVKHVLAWLRQHTS